MKKQTLRIIISLFTLITLVLSMTFSSLANIPQPGGTPPWASDDDNDGLTYHQEHLELNPYRDNPLAECDEYGVPNGVYDSNIADTDGNNILDSQEDLDEDGIINIDELTIFSIIYDPIIADTDNNSVLDGDEDYDADGLTNIEELYIYHTNPLIADTDEDGLSDFVEVNNFNSAYDPNTADTDDNEIIDGQEDYDVDGINNVNELTYFTTIYNLEMADTDNNSVLDGDEDYDTDGIINKDEVNVFNGIYDPILADSDENSTLDGSEDYDQDELTNIEELYTYSTNPLNSDTDGDGFTDGEEIAGVGENNQYLTDPLKYDTDEDYISDFDEIELGLNPLLEKTDGDTFDYDRTFEAEIDSNSDVFYNVNNTESAFNVSVEIKSAGNPQTQLKVDNSVYGSSIYSNSIIGSVMDFSYSQNLAVEEFTLNFEVKNGENPSNLGIFQYNSAEKILLPIETTRNGNILTAQTNETGTYCIKDLNQITINNYTPDYANVVEFNGNKYLKIGFSDIINGGLTWEQASDFCNRLGGHLATVTTTDEQNFIVNTVISTTIGNNNNSGGYWLGAECTGTSWLKDTITWITGEEVDYSQTLYGNGNNLWISTNGEWYNSVSGGIGFICEWEEEFDFEEETIEVLSSFTLEKMKISADLTKSTLQDKDSDFDGISDWDEININSSFMNLNGSNTEITSLSTLSEIIEILGNNSNISSDLEVLALNSNLFDPDTDCDGIPDIDEYVTPVSPIMFMSFSPFSTYSAGDDDDDGIPNDSDKIAEANLPTANTDMDLRFDIVKDFQKNNIHINTKLKNSDSPIFAKAYPNSSNNSFIITSYDNLNIIAVVAKYDVYWLKVKRNNSVMDTGYIKVSDTNYNNTYANQYSVDNDTDALKYIFRDDTIVGDKMARKITSLVRDPIYYNQQQKNIHRGLDIVDDKGKIVLGKNDINNENYIYPVYSVFSGEVVLATDENDGYGNKIVIKTNLKNSENENYYVRYAHLRDTGTKNGKIVKYGDKVTPYTMLGYVGGSGKNGEYPYHLHFEIFTYVDNNPVKAKHYYNPMWFFKDVIFVKSGEFLKQDSPTYKIGTYQIPYFTNKIIDGMENVVNNSRGYLYTNEEYLNKGQNHYSNLDTSKLIFAIPNSSDHYLIGSTSDIEQIIINRYISNLSYPFIK